MHANLNFNTLRSQPPLIRIALVLFTLAPLYFVSYQYRLRHPYGAAPPKDQYVNRFPPSSPAFEQAWLNTSLVGPFHPASLRRYCTETKIVWHRHLTFRLPNANGGIGNVRGNFLDFVMFAIEAGATSLVLPSMAARDDQDLFNVWAGRQAFGAFFDEDWFVEKLAEACPQIRVVPDLQQDPDESQTPLPFHVPRSRRADVDPANTRAAYLAALDQWVEATTGLPIAEHDAPLTIDLERTLWEFDTYSLPWDIRRELGLLLRTRTDVRHFAAQIIRQLGVRYNLDLDASEPVPRQGFFAGHLRTESDAQFADFLLPGETDALTQTNAMLAAALAHGHRVLYIATGSAADLAIFKTNVSASAPHRHMNVTSKFDLLDPDAAEAVRQLTWDQQALVDYEVLLRSGFFVGMVKSSFSYQIAVTRNQRLRDLGRVVDAFAVVDRESNVAMADGLSRMTGSATGFAVRVPRGMWP